MKKALKKIVALVAMITVIFPLSLCFTGCDETPEREYKLPSIDDDFKPGVLSIGLTAEYSEVNKPIVKEDFITKKMVWKEDVKGDMEKALKKYVVIDHMEDAFHIDDPSTVKNPKAFKQMLDVYLVNQDKQSVITAIKEFYKFSYVEWVEEWGNALDIDCAITNDEYFDSQWGLKSDNGIAFDRVLNILGVNAGERVKVGIFEKNIQTDHPDLNVCGGNFTPASSASATHGTLVAGIIGATINNGIGISGIAPVDIYLLDRDTDSFADSLEWAYNNGIRIVNASFAYMYTDHSPWAPKAKHIAAIKTFSENGGIIIAAAGNENTNNDVTPYYPAGYANYEGIDNVISVGAINAAPLKVHSSNYGANSVSIYAPGQNILSTYPESEGKTATDLDVGYAYGIGTSFAAPFVTGVAALLLSLNPNLTVAEIKEAIIDGADDIVITVAEDDRQTVKKLNAAQAVLNVVASKNAISISKPMTLIRGAVNADSALFSKKKPVEKLCVDNTFEYTFSIVADSPINVEFYNEYLTPIALNGSYGDGACKYNFEMTLEPGIYYIASYYRLSSHSGTISFNITGRTHPHVYDDWKYYDRTKHIEMCTICKITGTQTTGHWVYASEIINNRVNCQGCHYVLDLRYDYANSILNSAYVKQVTLNGSYILPSGTVVLVEEDVLAYLNGTLTFYDEDRLPNAA